MSENQAGINKSEDDLDLINLFERLFSFFKRYAVLIAIFSLTGVLLGYGSYKTSTRMYASSLLLHSFTLTNTEQINIIDNWNELLKNREYGALSVRLHCDQGMLHKVKKISAAETQKLYIQNNPNGFIVDVMVNDNAVLDTLQRGIVYGLESSDYMKARLESKRSNLVELIDKSKVELSRLDSTKRIIENSINGNGPHSSSFIVDVSNINTQVITLNEKLLDFEEQLKFTSAVQVLHGFEKFEKPATPKLFKSVVLGFIAGFALGYITAVVLYIKRKIRHRRFA